MMWAEAQACRFAAAAAGVLRRGEGYGGQQRGNTTPWAK